MADDAGLDWWKGPGLASRGKTSTAASTEGAAESNRRLRLEFPAAALFSDAEVRRFGAADILRPLSEWVGVQAVLLEWLDTQRDPDVQKAVGKRIHALATQVAQRTAHLASPREMVPAGNGLAERPMSPTAERQLPKLETRRASRRRT
jgi:hypothetical protein